MARVLSMNKSIDLAGLILWSSIVSVRESCANLTGKFISNLVRERWAPISDLPLVTCPVLFITGERDCLTTTEACNRLRAGCKSAYVTFKHSSETADHNVGWDTVVDVIEPIEGLLEYITKRTQSEANGNNLGMIYDDDIVDHPTSTSSSSDDDKMKVNRNHFVLSSSSPSTPTTIVIVGSGPVGLWTACSLIHRGFKGSSILCLDKYETFQRSHVLSLDPSSIERAPEPLKKLVEGLVGVTRTNILESTLQKEAIEQGVMFKRPYEVTDFEKLLKEDFMRDCECLIACDGAHSILRTQLFGGLEKRATLEYVLHVRAEIVAPRRPKKLPLMDMIEMFGRLVSVRRTNVAVKELTLH